MTLHYETAAAHVYQKLKQIPRTGWVERRVPNPETVFDHTVSLITLGTELAPALELSTEETGDLLHMLEVHDWPEAIVGDEVIMDENPADESEAKDKKFIGEQSALKQLISNQTYSEAVLKSWERFEAGEDKVAVLAKELDKYQAVELALMYEENHNIPLFEEFDTYSKKHINHPVLTERLTQLRGRHQQISFRD